MLVLDSYTTETRWIFIEKFCIHFHILSTIQCKIVLEDKCPITQVFYEFIQISYPYFCLFPVNLCYSDINSLNIHYFINISYIK